MRTAGMIAGGIAWCVLVFVGVFYLTFPSDAVIARIQSEWPNGPFGRDSTVAMSSVSPWWVGLSAADVQVFQAERGGTPDAELVQNLMARANDVRVRVSPWSLLSGNYRVVGAVTFTDASVDFRLGTEKGERGQLDVRSVDVKSKELPLADLLMLMPGLTASADGTIDLDAVVEAGEKGMADAKGRIDIGGSSIVLSDVELPSIGPLGMDVPVSVLKIAGNIDDGEWEIDEGRLDSDLFDLRIEGSVSLRDPVDRSTLDIELVLSDLGEELSAFESFLSSAEGDDGDYHFLCRGMVSRLRGCTPKGKSRRSTRRTSSVPTPSGSASIDRTPSRAPTAVDSERERRREEIRERLRKRREEREAMADEDHDHEDPAPLDDIDAAADELDDERFLDEGDDDEPLPLEEGFED